MTLYMQDNIVYGIHVVSNLLKNAPHRVLEVYLSELRSDEKLKNIQNLAEEQDIPVLTGSKKQFKTWVKDAIHQGVMAKVKPKETISYYDLLEIIKNCENNSNSTPLLLILDGVQDPHNLGACLRTADAAGVTAVIIPKDRSVGLTPLVHKVASGAAETMPVIEVTNLARTMEDLKKENFWLMGTTDPFRAIEQSGKKSGSAGHSGKAGMQIIQSLYQTDLRGRIAIVLGAEGAGLRRLTEEHCDILMQIPMLGTVESLNVSVAAGVCLYEALRQRSG